MSPVGMRHQSPSEAISEDGLNSELVGSIDELSLSRNSKRHEDGG